MVGLFQNENRIANLMVLRLGVFVLLVTADMLIPIVTHNCSEEFIQVLNWS